jgi:serine protease Do
LAALWDLLVRGPAPGDPVPFEESPVAKAMGRAIDDIPTIVCEVLGDGQRRAFGTIVSPNGSVLTKASELYGKISCRLADGRELPATVLHRAREHDLAVLKIDAANLPQIQWSPRKDLPVGLLVAAMRGNQRPTVGIVSHAIHEVPPATGYFGFGNVKDAEGGVELEEVHAPWNSVVEDAQTGQILEMDGTPVRVGDVLLSIGGHPVPTVRALEQLAKRRGTSRTVWDIPFAVAGDPICITFQRDGEERTVRTPLLSPIACGAEVNRRNGALPAVFDTDASLTRDQCGGPLVDCDGQVAGITIAVPSTVISGSPVATRVYVIPSPVARAVADAASGP